MNATSPKVSILISVYNGERTIKRCIECLLAQDYDNFEIVVINDGSTDRTAELLNHFDDQKLTIIHRPHEGLVPALNFGLTQCEGEFIARMDADDWCPPERIKMQAIP